jgi:hypothetical protein
MTDEDINWFEGKYPSWQDDIERSAKAAIDEIHQMARDAMPNKRMGISCRMGFDLEGLGNLFNAAYDEYCKREDVERLISNSKYQYNAQPRNCNPYANRGMQGGSMYSYYQNLGMQGQSYSSGDPVIYKPYDGGVK